MTIFTKNIYLDITKENIDIWLFKVCMRKEIQQMRNKFKDLKSKDSQPIQIRLDITINRLTEENKVQWRIQEALLEELEIIMEVFL